MDIDRDSWSFYSSLHRQNSFIFMIVVRVREDDEVDMAEITCFCDPLAFAHIIFTLARWSNYYIRI